MPQFDPAQFDRPTLLQTLGMRHIEMTPDRVVLEMDITPQVHQPFGFLHGGASVALAESVASIGGYLNLPDGYACFGLEINCNHLRSKRDGVLYAVGQPLHRGRTTQVWEIKLYDGSEAGPLIAAARCTLAVVPIDRA